MHILLLKNGEPESSHGDQHDRTGQKRQLCDSLESGLVPFHFLGRRVLCFSLMTILRIKVWIFLICRHIIQIVSHVIVTILSPTLFLCFAGFFLRQGLIYLLSVIRLIGLIWHSIDGSCLHVLAIPRGQVFVAKTHIGTAPLIVELAVLIFIRGRPPFLIGRLIVDSPAFSSRGGFPTTLHF